MKHVSILWKLKSHSGRALTQQACGVNKSMLNMFAEFGLAPSFLLCPSGSGSWCGLAQTLLALCCPGQFWLPMWLALQTAYQAQSLPTVSLFLQTFLTWGPIFLPSYWVTGGFIWYIKSHWSVNVLEWPEILYISETNSILITEDLYHSLINGDSNLFQPVRDLFLDCFAFCYP